MPLDASKVKARRAALGMTQREAAKRAGIPPSHWSSRIEGGERSNPSLETVERVAAVLRCPVTALLSPTVEVADPETLIA